MPSTSVQVAAVRASEASLEAARTLAGTSGRRVEIPVRASFVRNDDAAVKPPLARLVSSRGRGGAVPLKLYLALLWRSSAEPFQTEILARRWALLLDLDEPNTLGARRITNALNVLEDTKLVHLERRRGESTLVTLLEESGSGAPYSLPSTAHQRAAVAGKPAHRYFKVPMALWTDGHIQQMSAAGVAMLLVLIEERNLDGRPTWWSTKLFPDRFNLSPTIRSRGTAELEEHKLLKVVKKLVPPGTGTRKTFARDRVRNTYQLRGVARPQAVLDEEEKQQAGTTRRRKPRSTRAKNSASGGRPMAGSADS